MADAASIGSVLIPEMERRGYSREFAGGITVAASTNGNDHPARASRWSSIAFIASESVGRLFLSGAIPGLILIGLVQMSINGIISTKRATRRSDIQFTVPRS